MKPRGSITGPLILIAVGVIFLAHAISPDFPLGDWLSRYWPYLLIAWGVVSLIEVSVRFLSGSPTGTLPANGVSSGAWLVIALICLLGVGAYEVRRPGAWWRQAGFERGMQAFGEEHEYSIDPLRRDVGVKPHIVLESFRGDAKIIGSAGTELVVGGHKTVRSFQKHDADTANSRTPVEIVVEGNTVIIRAHQDRADSHSGVTTNLELSVPKGASLDATGTLGDFDITSLAGDIDVSSGNAGVRLEDVGGNVKVETRKSDLIRCTNVKGSVDLRGRGSDVELSKIEGLVTISADYTGTVALRELTKPVRVKSLRTQIDAEAVPGEIRLDRGSLNAQNLIGPIKVVAHSTDVTLKGFTQELDLNVDRGDVELSPRSVPLGHIAVHARSGNIEIALPESAKFALNATTENGEIDNQFGDVLKETTSGRGGRLEGSIGSGPDVSLVTQHGSITLRKASGDAAANTAFRNGSEQPNKNSDPLAALLLSTLPSARR